jgi:WD40 repeat protein
VLRFLRAAFIPQLAHKLVGHTDAVLAVDPHPTNPHRLASGGAGLDKTVRLWQAQGARADREPTSTGGEESAPVDAAPVEQ